MFAAREGNVEKVPSEDFNARGDFQFQSLFQMSDPSPLLVLGASWHFY